MFKTPKQMGIDLPQVLEICEELWNSRSNKMSCPDCGVEPGEQHDPNCDVSMCTSCGMQRLSCDCEDGETDIWSGIWPGIKECYDQRAVLPGPFSGPAHNAGSPYNRGHGPDRRNRRP